jgi:broad specificity phosphatase PhoE
MKPSKILLSLAVVLFSTAASAQTIVLVRHAEKVSEAPDAVLSDVGQQRAEKLARTLADAGITAIFTSEAERTKQTAGPLAKLLHLQPTVIAAKDVAGLVTKLTAQPEDAIVLVVGHSNTLPEIINKLPASDGSSARHITTNDVDYDKLFIAVLHPSKNSAASSRKTPTLLILHY